MSDIQTVPEETTAGHALKGAQIAQAAGVVMIGIVLSRVLGLVLDILLAGTYRLSPLYDAYVTASRPPETIYLVVAGGALGSAFIPEFVSFFVRGDEDKAWRLASSVANAFMLVMAAVCALAMIFADPLVRYALAPGFVNEPETMALTIHLMRIMLITPFIFTLSGLLMGILNARQSFLLPALAPSLYNLGIIFGLLVLAPTMGLDGLAWGTVVGAVMHLVVQIPGLVRLKPVYRPVIEFRDSGLWRVLKLMGPRVVGLAIVQVNFWVALMLASYMTEGSIGALKRGFGLMLMPQAVIAQSVAIAVFPTFSAQAAGGAKADLRRTLGQSLRSVLFLSLPAAVGLIVLRLPLVRVIYEHGSFTPSDSQAVAWALMFYTFGLVAHALLEIVTRAFYAMSDTRTPVIIGGVAMLLNIFLSLTLPQMVGQPGSLEMGPFGGLALALTISTTIEVIGLLILLRPRVMEPGQGRAISLREIASVGRMAVASAVMGAGLWLVLPLLPTGSDLMLAVATGAAVIAAGAVYWGIAWALGSDEVRMLTGVVMRRIGRRRPATGLAGE